MKLKVVSLHAKARIPTYAYPGDAGMDLYAVEGATLRPGVVTKIPIGISIELPKGSVGLIWEKSGLAFNHMIKTVGGVIDEGFRGEVAVGLINMGKKPYVVEVGHKVAQLLIQRVHHPRIHVVKALTTSKRGEKGYGSSGR